MRVEATDSSLSLPVKMRFPPILRQDIAHDQHRGRLKPSVTGEDEHGRSLHFDGEIPRRR